MKFGKRIAEHRDLQGGAYAAYYMDYEGLKEGIKNASDQDNSQESLEALAKILDDELRRVNTGAKILSRFVEETVQNMTSGVAPTTKQDIENIRAKVEYLRSFADINYSAFVKGTKKCDKVCLTDFQTKFLPQVDDSDFRKLDLDSKLKEVDALARRKPPAKVPEAGAGSASSGRRGSPLKGLLETEAAKAAQKTWKDFATAGIDENKALQVDVKTVLSNERTVLRWLRIAVALASLSAFLTTRDHPAEKLDGFMVGFLALIICFWPVRVFWKRSIDFANTRLEMERVEKGLTQVLALSMIIVFSLVLAGDIFLVDRSETLMHI
mmetsp:Transcript_19584/g.45540  ORF Transcript_19584/g.45540 Transcript_19584/m.45540 type:complete len:324 (+) Transcript_19584:117-1088(+)